MEPTDQHMHEIDNRNTLSIGAEQSQHQSPTPTPPTMAPQPFNPNYIHSGFMYGHGQQRLQTPNQVFPHQSQPTTQLFYPGQFYSHNTPVMPNYASTPTNQPSVRMQETPTQNFLVDSQGHRISPRRAGGRVLDKILDAELSSDEPEVIPAPDFKGKGKAKQAKKDKGSRKETGKQKKKGQGSKSGVNARQVGKSDDEIEDMDENLKTAADIKTTAERAVWTDDDKKKVVSYCIDSTRWPDFKVKQGQYFQQISQRILPSKSPEQVRSCWNRTFALYAAVVARQEHTGGGDGDEFKLDQLDLSQVQIEDEGESKRKKRGRSKSAPQFSEAQLDAFEQSELFQMLDEVARDHPNIRKMFDVSSEKPVETEDEEEDTNIKTRKKKIKIEDSLTGIEEILGEAVRNFASTKQETSRREEERMLMERERNLREAAASKLQHEERKHRLLAEKWQAYHAALEHPDPFTRKRAEKLKKEIAELEGFELEDE
ncbi:uncharacterized protein FOMMEDRAFT_156200 [Fomitiporia mediterranea MF3/22]|uniref:uncharacterized protein n=1 Tax=Fomitiporia mediterranea (strain MF3/22) TaxID=694068 RepID=UPI0004407921|nr:uncharacterized protein FOMMEDRAFT_156200 [Fomitiporia mediterranea MF3/22]EJD02843.1 hypothetical protein FOMMEDRAFT_156200 [Fomitiporia mediterranea MF3/22]